MRFTLVAISTPVEGREDECGRWYDDTHLPDMLAVPGVIAAQRFELVRGAPSKAFKRFMAIYEVEAENEDAARQVITTLNGANLPLSEALDVTSVNLGIFKPTGPRQAEYGEPSARAPA